MPVAHLLLLFRYTCVLYACTGALVRRKLKPKPNYVLGVVSHPCACVRVTYMCNRTYICMRVCGVCDAVVPSPYSLHTHSQRTLQHKRSVHGMEAPQRRSSLVVRAHSHTRTRAFFCSTLLTVGHVLTLAPASPLSPSPPSSSFFLLSSSLSLTQEAPLHA